VSLNTGVPEAGTITVSYHGRNHYNLLRWCQDRRCSSELFRQRRQQ
jgi:hypothetical protein